MGFMKGGQVKDTGLMPASKGVTDQDKEAGGHGKLKPGYKKEGKVTDGYRKVMKGGKMCYMKGGKTYMMKGGKMHPYMGGGRVSPSSKGNERRNSVNENTRGEGESVKAVGRGKKNISK